MLERPRETYATRGVPIVQVVLLESGSREPRAKVIKTVRDSEFPVYWEATGHGGTPGSM